MKRREFLRAGAAAALAGPAFAAPAIAQSAPEIKWRMTSSFPKSLERMFGTAQMLCRYVAEATDNKFQIQAYAAGELAPSRQALDAVTSGAVECAHTPLCFYVGKDPALGFGTGLPFGLNARHQQSWWTFGGGGDIVNASLKKLNVYGIPAGLTGAQMGGWFKKEINSLDDLKGLRFRISGMGGPMLERVGAVPHDLPHADVYRRAGERHHRCRRIHLPARRREARPGQGGEVQLLPLLVGKRRHGASGRQSREDGTRCPSPIRPSSRGPATRPMPGCSRKYDARQPCRR